MSSTDSNVARSRVISSPHAHSSPDVASLMTQVLFALAPGVVVYIGLFGFGVAVHIMVAILAAYSFEVLVARLRGQSPAVVSADRSVLVLAVLFALAMPPYAPWWLTVYGIAFAVLLAKHAFGGLGQNVFNPAMTGYVAVLVTFPVISNQWPAATSSFLGPVDSITLIFNPAIRELDGITGATILDYVKTQTSLMKMHSELTGGTVFGHLGGRGWEWISLTYAVGGVWLMWRGVIGWRLPLGFLFGIALGASVGYIADPELHRGVIFHWFSGATLLAAFYIVTDPVTSPVTPRGMLVFSVMAGLVTIVFREFGDFPDGVAFAVVLMNSVAPLIDRLTRPRVHGTAR